MKQINHWAAAVKLLLMMIFVVTGFWIMRDASAVLRTMAFHDNFERADLKAWRFPHPDDWEILGKPSQHYLHMKRNGEPGVPRRPLQFALLNNTAVGSFDFQTRLRREGKSVIVVFNYVDTLHFYYTHLSVDRGEVQPVHNGIFIVNGEDRKRIAGISAAPALPDPNWHRVRIARDASSGSIDVYMDDATESLFSVVDKTFRCGLVGIGSFDETGDFTDVELGSKDAGCKPAATVLPADKKVANP